MSAAPMVSRVFMVASLKFVEVRILLVLRPSLALCLAGPTIKKEPTLSAAPGQGIRF
jgi:hypothetical protein